MPLSPRMPDLAAMEVLLAVAEHGSFGAAGRALGLSQQAVSARIASIESQTGVRLLSRSTTGSRLTTEGTVVVEWAGRLLTVADEVDAGLASLRQESRSRLRVSASLTVAEHLLPRWLVSLQTATAAHGGPSVEVVVQATNTDHVIDQVREGASDVGFVEGPRPPAGLRSQVVAQDELVVVVPPRHPWARRPRPITAAELSTTPLVTREAGSGTRDFLSRLLTQQLGPDHAPSRPALELSTTAGVRAAVIAGAAPAVVSRLAVADDLAAGRLREVPVLDLVLRRDLRAVWTGTQVPPPGPVRDLLNHIRSSHSR